jgi:hypothetical protein
LALLRVGATINHTGTVINHTICTYTILAPIETKDELHLPLFPHPGVVPVGGGPHKLTPPVIQIRLHAKGILYQKVF